ncbi:MAG: hypothetical protein ACD_72C00229G0002 [uncultured bacterium]|nr:MAG: hypothetical protein ACD_72C00229G0002 [uncultured bacterium]
MDSIIIKVDRHCWPYTEDDQSQVPCSNSGEQEFRATRYSGGPGRRVNLGTCRQCGRDGINGSVVSIAEVPEERGLFHRLFGIPF